MVDELLGKLMYNGDLPAYRLNRAFSSRRSKPLLKDVTPAELVAWCAKSDSPNRFAFAAKAIDPFSTPKGEEKKELTPQALFLLQEAPDQEQVLSAYASACSPNSWSGKRSEIVEARRAALASLRDFPPLKVHDQLEELLRLLNDEIARDREHERESEERMERTFE
jgi:hypothetical protein